jgi:hypothetical protein
MLETYIIGASDGLVDTFPLFGDCFSSLIAFFLSIRSGSAGTSGVAPNDGSIHGDAIKQTSPLEALLLLPLSLHFPLCKKRRHTTETAQSTIIINILICHFTDTSVQIPHFDR